jgi:hypothetical protein
MGVNARVCADALLLVPSPLSLPSCPVRTLEILFLFLFYFFGSCCRVEKKKKIFRLLVFNPQAPRAPQALWAKPREEEGFFDLVPLVTHPSSNRLLGGVTPKFLSLSLHSL